MAATVHPGPGEDISTVAATLLGLAGHPSEVVFVPEDAAFTVPDELADKYIQHHAPADKAERKPRKVAGRRGPARQAEEE